MQARRCEFDSYDSYVENKVVQRVGPIKNGEPYGWSFDIRATREDFKTWNEQGERHGFMYRRYLTNGKEVYKEFRNGKENGYRTVHTYHPAYYEVT